MASNELVLLIALVGVSLAASLLVLWITGLLIGKPSAAKPAPEVDLTPENTVLLKNGMVVKHDISLSGLEPELRDWSDLRTWLGDRFETLEDLMPDDIDIAQTYLASEAAKDPGTVTINSVEGLTQVTLADPAAGQAADRHEALRLHEAQTQDLAALQNAPCAIWKTDNAGDVFWQNEACRKILGGQIATVLDEIDPAEDVNTSQNMRVAVDKPHHAGQSWLDVHCFTAEEFRIYYATDITSAVQAETAQREFVQTLTKTFANLTTGLAIFDRNQQLALFNPALVDLTALPAEFLSARPGLMSFFDNLRDRQVMPEPKSYAEWRTQINEMVATASDGLYQETWSLPSGVTYRVTGRPHPDGAVAFLFEDITAEISLTRRFRAQNDLRQAVMDKLDHAVAVIAPNNVVIFCNATWTDMFGVDPDTSFAELGIRDLVAICRQKFPHPEFWHSVETQTTCKTLSHPIEATIETETAGPLQCRLVPVAGGAALICRLLDKTATAEASVALTS